MRPNESHLPKELQKFDFRPAMSINVQPKIKNSNNFQLSESNRSRISNLNSYYILTAKTSLNIDSVFNDKSLIKYIEFIEPIRTYRINQNMTKPNDPLFNLQWGLSNIHAQKAWQKATGKGIVVGVIDTGIEWNHPDLINSLWINAKEDINKNGRFDPWLSTEIRDGVSGDFNNIDDDGDGYVDDVIGYDFVNQSIENLGDWQGTDPIPYDENGHGTLVSGVIAATSNNNIGITGLAFDAKIMVLRAFDINGNSQTDNIANAVVFAVMNGAKVINCSFGELYSSQLLKDVFDLAISMGVTVVASAGNEGSNSPHYPSDYDGVISVGYSNSLDKRDNFSNYGQRLTLLAPGVKIKSTSFDGLYKDASGSSLAAPFVSATAAMLLEQNNSLKPLDICGIMQSTATKIDKDGWNIYSGSGILNAGDALSAIAPSNITIRYPENNQEIFKPNIGQSGIPIVAYVATPLFDNYMLLLGLGNNPDRWDTIFNYSNQSLNDTIAYLSSSNLIDTTYIIRLVVNLKNKTKLENRSSFLISSNTSKIKIFNAKIIPVYKDGKRILLAGITTNRNSIVTIGQLSESTNQYTSYSDQEQITKYHVIPIDYNLIPGDEYNFKVNAQSSSKGIPIDSTTLIFKMPDDKFPIDKIIQKKYSTPLSYLFNKTADFYGDSSENYVANDITNGIWQSTKIFQYKQDSLITKDSTSTVSLPVGIGDSNGDGLNEILTRSLGSTIVYQPKSSGKSPFSNIIFADTTSGNLFAGEFYDFTKDGKPDIIAYSDTAFHLITYANGKYLEVARTHLDSPNSYFGTAPGVVCEDFDNDGYDELCFGNEKGNVFIFEFRDNKFNLEWSSMQNVSSSPQYILKADIDNDGIPEIVIGNFGTSILFDANVPVDPIWTYKVLKSYEPNNYSFIWADNFYGVRQGSTPAGVFYRNGLAVGNIDNKPGDELIIAPFPNFYVFKWDVINRKFIPFWWYPSSFTNSAIIHDFDKNGINEFGFSTGQSTDFFEFNQDDSKPRIPVEFQGWSIDDSTVTLQWKSQEKGLRYNILTGIESFGKILLFRNDTISESTINISPLKLNNYYYFGISSSKNNIASNDTFFIKIYHHSTIKPLKCEILNKNNILIKFSGKLADAYPDISKFRLKTPDLMIPETVNRKSDSEYLCFFSELKPGNVLLEIDTFRDYYNAPTKPDSFNLIIPQLPISEPALYLKSLRIVSNLELELQFSEPTKKSESIDLRNYHLLPVGSIDLINETNDPSIFQIILTPNSGIGALGRTYTLTVSDVHSLSNTIITSGAGNTLSFVFFKDDFENVFVYPNPAKMSESDGLYFANLSLNSNIIILTLDGKEILQLAENDGNGGIYWDGRDKDGNSIPSGIYLFKVEMLSKSGSKLISEPKKFAIVR
jgi:subtilisin family serine protease